MRTVIIYRENKSTGEVEKEVIERKFYGPSYDAQIDLPLHQRILNTYRDLEAQGKLRPTDIIHSKSYMRRLHEDALARESR